MATLQVRSIDDKLYKALGQQAAMENRSISQEVIAILKAYLSSPKQEYKNATTNFLNMCGTWNDERNAEEIIQEIRNARNENDRYTDIF